MKKSTTIIWSLLLAFTFLIPFTGFAQLDKKGAKQLEKERKRTPQVPAVTDNPNALLWEISGKELEKPSYLYGTIHLISKNDFRMSELVKDRFWRTDQLTLEIDMDNMAGMLSALTKAFMDDGTTLEDLLTEAEYQELTDYFETNLGMPMSLLNRIKPIFLSTMVTEQGIMGEVTSYETEFMAMAQDQSKETLGLETVEFQMSLFDEIPYEDQAEMLMESLQGEGDGGIESFNEMVEMYKAENLQALHTYITEESEDLGDFEDVLLNKRNEAWIPIMEEQMTSKPTFFAVGAGHLSGKRGVIELLKAEGYTLTPLRSVTDRP
ncbi:MAG: TraB/GumN family protein [Bacteroidota bacterium]